MKFTCRSIDNTVSVSVLDGTNPTYIYIPAIYYDGVNDNIVTGIEENGFNHLTNLENIIIPNTITSIGATAFNGCTSLQLITIPDSVLSIDDDTFSHCNSLISVSIPDSVTSIGSNVFSDCPNLTRISIPTSTTSIGDYAFYNCSSISIVRFDGNYPTIGTNAFVGLASDAVIYFNPDNTGWTHYGNINGVSTVALVYISGTFTQQQTLSATTKLIETGLVPNGTTLYYQWYADSTPIIGETSSTLVLKYEQVSKNIHVVVSYNIGGSLTSINSISSPTVDTFNNLPSGSVSIVGSNIQGSLLSTTNTIVDIDGLGTLNYQWYRNNVSSNVGGTAIDNATNNTYIITSADVQRYIYVKVYYNDGYGNPEMVYSNPTIQVEGITPTYLSASSYGDESSTITFDITPDSDSYEVYAYIDGSDSIFSTTTGSTSPITVSGLSVDTSFNFKVSSVYGTYITSPSIASNTVEIYSSSGLTINANSIRGFTGTQSNLLVPSNVSSIGPISFENNTDIQKVYIGRGVISISVGLSTHSFVGCTNINTFKIDPSNTTYSTDGYSLLNAPGTILYQYIKQPSASYTIPNTVRTIGAYAFGNCSGLTSLSIGRGVISINVGSTIHSFVGCTNINNFIVDASNTTYSTDGNSLFNATGTILYQYMKQTLDTYTIPNTIRSIAAYAFGNCTGLTSLTIGSGVTSISVGSATHSFVGCSNINTFTLHAMNSTYSTDGNSLFNATGTILYQYMKQTLETYTIPNTILTIGSYAFGNCTSLTSITIGSGVTSISVGSATHSFVGCSNIINFTIDASNTIYSTDGNSLLNATGTTLYQYMKQSSETYTIPNTIRSIAAYAFGNCTGLTSLTIGSGVTSISVGSATHSFVGCSNIINFTIDPSNTSYSTDGNSLLNTAGTIIYQYVKQSSASYTVPNTIRSIAAYAFGNCTGLTSLIIGSGVTSISVGSATHSFVDCSNMINFTIDASNTSYSTDGNSLLNTAGTIIYQYVKQSSASYTVPNTIRSIAAYAFGNCTGLTSLIIGSGVTSISVGSTTHSFAGCANINTFIVNASNITYSTDGKSLFNAAGTIIYQYIKQSTASYSIPNTVLSIGSYAFGNCAGLTSLTIGSGVTSIGTDTFRSCTGLTTFVIPSNVTTIGTGIFFQCSGLTSLILGSGITSISIFGIGGCTSLTSIIIPNNITVINTSAFSNCTSLTSVSIGSGVTSIAVGSTTHSFIGCSAISNFTIHASNTTYYTDGSSLLNKAGTILYHYIKRASASYITPNTITTVNANAFYNCTGLTSLTLGTGITSIASSTFTGCSNLSLTIKYPSIAVSQYSGYTSITNVILGSTVTTVGTSAFNACTGITSFTVGRGVTSIALGSTTHSFIGCSSISNFTIDASNNTYYTDGSSLLNKAGTILYHYIKRASASYIIPNAITTVNANAFYNCTGLTSLTIGRGVTSIAIGSISHSFIGCSAISNFTIDASNTTYYTDGSSLLNKAGTILYHYIKRASASYITPNTITTLNTYAFYNCTELTSLTIGSGVTNINANAFSNCSGLTSIIIPNNVTIISTLGFDSCTSLTSVSIGSGITSIAFGSNGNNSFNSCAAINSITVDASNTTYSTDGYSLLNKAGTILYQYLRRASSTYQIGNTVTTIGSYAFQNMGVALTSVSFGNNVTTISSYSIINCTGLTKLTIPASVTSVAANAVVINSNLASIIFNGNRPSTITVATSFASNKTGCVGYYYPDKTGWPGTSISGLTLISLLAITGTKANGRTLTARQYLSTIGATGLTYQWYSNSYNSNIDGSAISGATSSTYVYNSSYTYVYVRISYTLGGSSNTLTSNAS